MSSLTPTHVIDLEDNVSLRMQWLGVPDLALKGHIYI